MTRELRRQFDLLRLITVKEITLKYKRTYLGILWSLLNPVLSTMIFYIAFRIFMRIRVENYTLFLVSAMFPWTAFSAASSLSASSLINNVSLIKKIRFPRQMLVISVVIAQLVNFLFSIPVICVVVLLYDLTPGLSWIAGIPILVVVQFTLTLGFCLALSMVNAYFRDMEYIIGIFLNMLFWLTPIIYPVSTVPERYRAYMYINPLTSLMSSWRELFMRNRIEWRGIGLSFAVSLGLLCCGMLIFQTLGRRIDEVL